MTKKLFDFVIGNPPYQEENKNNGRQSPVYNLFLDESFKLSSCVEMIHPARFLFDAGQTPKKWNTERLNDSNFKVLMYNSDASTVFPTTEIKGGIAITIRNENKEYGAIKIFTSFKELNGIIKHVLEKNRDSVFLDSIISSRGCYRTSSAFFEDFPEASSRLGKGTGNMIASNFFEKVPEAYTTEKSNECYGILSRVNNHRTICYIKKKYVQNNEFINKFNLAFPKSNGNGIFGEVLTSPDILKPFEGASDTFISIGKLDTYVEAENLKKYICTKFFRTMLGVKKATQDNPRSVWSLIPLQDFTTNSDINWSKSIHEIDLQLYKKYGLTDDEINFIETHVKEME